MNKAIFILFCILTTFEIMAQSPIGAWRADIDNGKTVLRSVLILTENHSTFTTYDSESGEFVSTSGGSWKVENNTITELIEFDSKNPERVGTKSSFDFIIKDSIMTIPDTNLTFTRIDNGTPGDLHGAWLMSGRTMDGEIQVRDTDTPRKTMKILSGTRFQWIAYNTETKQFMVTGGGTYKTQNGTYTENIEFFSKDNSRVGLSLEFQFNLKDENWHHTGFSSKGDSIDEVWSKRK
jgi:hypothetical protein